MTILIHIGEPVQVTYKAPNKSQETNQKPAGGFLIAHFKR